MLTRPMKRLNARKRLNASERALFRQVVDDASALDNDLNQRFLNALLSLSQSDPQWMIWVEENLPRRVDDLYQRGRFRMYLQLVESAARWYKFRAYGFLGRQKIGGLVFNDHYPFTERGNLRTW